MPIWKSLKDEFGKAGRAAGSALDEGKLRLTLMRARQVADRSAQQLGYAVYRAKARGAELAVEEYDRHATALGAAEAEVARLESLLKEAAAGRRKPAEGETAGSSEGETGKPAGGNTV
ncbi:MAG TPA: hypothetical protein VFK16_02120 [Gemmatimonadaceae bacterium]|nr:hypothetical protein [Gemmatimonadaceae bacterium]